MMSENTNLISLLDETKDLVSYLPEHGEMIGKIESYMPVLKRDSSFFFKTQSQFMDNILTVSQRTPLRSVRQILAEINKASSALREVQIKHHKKRIEIKIKQKKLAETEDELEKEMLHAEIVEIEVSLESSAGYISGAIRKIAGYIEQLESIKKKHGIEDFNELDFEKEEEKYHIMKAFEQALCAARSRGGVIDEGNMIYFTQIGINGAAAQKYLIQYLKEESQLMSQGQDPSFEMFINFLEQMADRFKGCAIKSAGLKGMSGTYTESALLKKGDTRLIDRK